MKSQDVLTQQSELIQSLAVMLETEGACTQFFETHISWVLVAGEFAYKFKKAVHFAFLDFSTIEARHFYCQEELRLNRRLAPDLYLRVMTISGSQEHPVVDGLGMPIEYAVQMRAFPQQALWGYRIEMGLLSTMEIDALASKIARFHGTADVAAGNSAWGTPNALQITAKENLETIAAQVTDPEMLKQVREIASWHAIEQQKLSDLFDHRKACGLIRECHGDLHSGNILTLDNQVEVFDCIEFSEGLRWIDVINDIVFIYMDLKFQGRHDLAARLLNQYLEISGDYEGVAVLRYYEMQRALVRCKAALLRVRQLRAEAKDAAPHQKQVGQYLIFSMNGIKPVPTAIMIMHGYSGSGKSTFSETLAELTGAIRIRSDVERKRLRGLTATDRVNVSPGVGLYDAAFTRTTYDRLCLLARQIVASGMPVIVDAACLKKRERELFEHLALELGVPFFIVDVRTSVMTMKARITARAQLAHDPSDAGLSVLEYQLAEHETLTADEMRQVIVVDGEIQMNRESVQKIVDPALSLLWCNKGV
jgi:aminoglycoside phosphotransferase family enzyme/predicted kinase